MNIGAVGQPRDGDARACAMVIDTDGHEVTYPVAENIHESGILDSSIVPARRSSAHSRMDTAGTSNR